MTYVIRSGSRLALPSAIPATTMTELERAVASMAEIDLWLDAAERPSEISALTLRERVRGLVLPVTSGMLSAMTVGGYPALDFADAGCVAAQYVIPASYFIAAPVEVRTLANTSQIAGSNTQDAQRLLFGHLSNGSLRLDHGTGGGQSIGTVPSFITAGAHLFWGSFDAATGAAQIGMDAISPAITGTLSIAHKASGISHFLGTTGTAGYGLDGRSPGLIVANRYLGGTANYDRRAAILAYLASLAGTALGA